MSNLIKHAIIKNGVVINVIEYEQTIQGTPPGFEDGVIAVPDENTSLGWHYVNGTFTDPNPPEQIYSSPSKSLTDMILEEPEELARLKSALGL
jgi:hypothetical protein